MAYITNFNFKRIYKEIKDSKGFEGVTSDGKIYPKINFDFFSRMEENELLSFKAFVSNPDFYIDHYLKVLKLDSSEFLNGDHPAYHSNPSCEAMLSDFVGVKIPEVIRRKGPETIKKFREFYRQNRDLFERNLSAFEMRASILFGERIKMEIEIHKNSGVHEIINYKLHSIEDEIYRIWSSLKDWLNDKQEGKKRRIIYLEFCKKTFLVSQGYSNSSIRYNNTPYCDNEIRLVLKDLLDNYKMPIMDLLKNYYIISINPDMNLNGYLLEKLGFVRCSHCTAYGFDVNNRAA